MDYAYFYYLVQAGDIFPAGQNLVATKVFISSPTVTNIGVTCCGGQIVIGTTGTYEITYSIVGASTALADQIIQMEDTGVAIVGSQMAFESTGTPLMSQTVTFLAGLSAGDILSINNITATGQVNLQAGSLVGITIQQIA